MRKMLAVGFLALAPAVWAADVTGKWVGDMALNGGAAMSACVHLKQDGATLAGTEGPSEENQFPITRGRIEGEVVTIEAQPGPAVLRMTMKLADGKLTGEVFEDDRKIGTVSLRRANQ